MKEESRLRHSEIATLPDKPAVPHSALNNEFATSLTDDDFDSSEPVPYLPEEDLDADSFFSEFEDSLLDDLFAIP